MLLVLLLLIPLVAAVLALFVRGAGVRWFALAATALNLALAAGVAGDFAAMRCREKREAPAPASPTTWKSFQPALSVSWDILPLEGVYENPTEKKTSAVRFHLGLDGLNVWLVLLTAVLMVSAVLGSWTSITERLPEYYFWLLALETGMIGVFLAFDILLFYVFFELTLVPLFFLIGIWGGPQRQHAARKFFIFTLTGSVVTLLGILGLVVACYPAGGLTFSIPRLIEIVHERVSLPSATEQEYWRGVQFWVFLALFAGFAIKVPLVPLHTWLPLAHVEAPTAGSVLLAGVLLKIGTYGFLRLCLPLAPDASLAVGVPLIGTLAVVGIIYGAFCALAQDDIKKLVAYSSVSHLGFCMLGMFALNETGLAGSLLQMVNHGLSTGALFLLVGMLYERYHTRKINDYGGLAAKLKLLALFMVFICLTSIGLPGLNGFVGEALVLMGMYHYEGGGVHGPTLAVLASSGIVLGAWYLLSMLRQVFFGPLKEPHVLTGHDDHGPVGDLRPHEWAALLPIAALCLVLGVYPQPFLDTAEREIKLVAGLAEEARQRVERPQP